MVFVPLLFIYCVSIFVTLLVTRACSEAIDFIYLWLGLTLFNTTAAAATRWEPYFLGAMIGILLVNWLVLARYVYSTGLKSFFAACCTSGSPIVLIAVASLFRSHH